ncbi:mediator complex subunit MED14-domain-containing protein [Xylariomycetidae sp. FL0641]|nr:mediator complex subunit MED14-domain-containing protein [Xylariomycetidae sp. FL0641]
MPGVVMMENGVRQTLPTNHDRSNGPLLNGANAFASQSSPSRQNGTAGKTGDGGINGTGVMVNGDGNGTGSAYPSTGEGPNAGQSAPSAQGAPRMNDLPDEIQHITEGYIPLGVLLSRLAQSTHNQLSDEIAALAKMPMPAPAVNGNSSHADASLDDTSPENLNKKIHLLNFVQERHAEWVKALIIANWSRKAEPVSKLIDLKGRIDQERLCYHIAIDYLCQVKRGLAGARMPNPDLRTALYVLATGQAPWMPDLNYVEPPSMSPKEQLQWIENLNTLLSIRLNLDDHDNIPEQFLDYSIDSGRVTFKVPGEFEVDLTIADEDFEKQFWFLDFRFAFTPVAPELPDSLRQFIEHKVNETLEHEGLFGCYKFLHEFVLTHKITEFFRQAFELSKGRWVETLKIERLNRAMSIQYWANRVSPDGPKSWILLGVHSGKKPGSSHKTSTSHLAIRWFMDGKEMMDVPISLDSAHVSTEHLLQRVVGLHIEHLLTTIHGRLKATGRFAKREAALALNANKDEPALSELKLQLSSEYCVSMKVSPITGLLALKPRIATVWKNENHLNMQSSQGIAKDGFACLERIRCGFVYEELLRRGKSVGWALCRKAPLKTENVKELLKLKDLSQITWLRRRNWPQDWYIMVSLSTSGDRWWLFELFEGKEAPRIGPNVRSYTPVPLDSGTPRLSDRFFSNLTVFSAALMAQITDLRTLHGRKVQHKPVRMTNSALPADMKVPSIFIRLTDLLGGQQEVGSSKNSSERITSWAMDFVQVMFKGVDPRSSRPAAATPDSKLDGASQGNPTAPLETCLRTFVDARIKVADPTRFSLLKGNVERDVAFNPRLGVFAFRLAADVGTTILGTLGRRLQALGRLADCVDAIRRSDRDVRCEDITLNKITFSYSDQPKEGNGEGAIQPNPARWKASLDLRTDKTKLSLEKGNPELRILECYQNLLSSVLGFDKLPFYLSSMLPMAQAFDAVEDAWEGLAMSNQGSVEIFTAHLDWYNVHYRLPGLAKNTQRRVTLQVRLRERDGDQIWHVFREEAGPTKQPDDEFGKALQKVWRSEERVWHCLEDGAAVETDKRSAALIKAIDDAIRPLAMQSPSVLKQTHAKGLPAKTQAQNRAMGANKARAQQQHQQQQHQQHQHQQHQQNIVVLDD